VSDVPDGKGSIGLDRARFLRNIDAWHAELATVQFTCSDAEKRAIIVELVFKMLLVELASRKHAGEEDDLKSCLEVDPIVAPETDPRLIEDFIECLDERLLVFCSLGHLFPCCEPAAVVKVLDPAEKNVRHFRDILFKIIWGNAESGSILEKKHLVDMTATISLAADLDIPGLYYERYMATDKAKKGIIYTPRPICKYIVQRTMRKPLDKIIGDAAAFKGSGPSERIIQEFCEFKVLDPACGTGPFLIEALRFIWSKYLELVKHIGTQRTDTTMAMMSLLLLQVHGIDEDVAAIEIARMNLCFEACSLMNPPNQRTIEMYAQCLRSSLREGNALVNPGIEWTERLVEQRQFRELVKEIVTGREETFNELRLGNRLYSILRAQRNLEELALSKGKEYIEDGNIGPLFPSHQDVKPLNPVVAFPHVFFFPNGILRAPRDRGFNAVIGNPPYVNYKKYLDRIDRSFLEKIYQAFNGQADLSYYFFELHGLLLKPGGMSGQISSRYFMQASHAVNLRRLLVKDEIVEIDDMNDCDMFGGIGIHPLLYFFRKGTPNPGNEFVYRYIPGTTGMNDDLDTLIEHALARRIRQDSLVDDGWSLIEGKQLAIKAKLERWPELGTLGECLGGAETGFDEAFVKHVINEKGSFFGIIDDQKYPLEPATVHPWLKNGDIRVYHHEQQQWCIYIPPDIDEATFRARFPGTFAFLSHFKQDLEARDNGRITVPWYLWRRPRNVKNLEVPGKIVLPYKAPGIRASIDTGKSYCSYDVTIFVPRKPTPGINYITGVLNSRAAGWYFTTYGKKMGGIYEFYSGPVARIRVPLPDAYSEQSIELRVRKLGEMAAHVGDGDEGIEETSAHNEEMAKLQYDIDALVFKLFKLTADEVADILVALNASDQDKQAIASKMVES